MSQDLASFCNDLRNFALSVRWFWGLAWVLSRTQQKNTRRPRGQVRSSEQIFLYWSHLLILGVTTPGNILEWDFKWLFPKGVLRISSSRFAG